MVKLLDNITITSILGIFTVPTEKGRYLQIQNRPTFALSFCQDDGVIVYSHNGKKIISNKMHAIILPANSNYTLYNEHGGNFPIINFRTLKPLTNDFITIKLKNPETYLNEFRRMRNLWVIPGNRIKVFSMLYDMLHKLSLESESTDPILTNAMDYLMKHLGNPNLKNADLAKMSRVSEVYFRRVFKQCYGITPKQYIINSRIEQAKRLLDEGISSVKSIAESCGFTSIYHFSRMFKSVIGLSPTEYSRRSIDKSHRI